MIPTSPNRFLLRSLLRSLLIALVAALLLVSAGCGARISRTQIIDRLNVDASLARNVNGFTTQPRGFQHPAIISKTRLTNILNAIEIDTSAENGATIRQPAFHPEIVEDAAAALSEAFEEAGPDDEVSVNLIRKEAQLGLFHNKYLTNFLAYMQDDHLYIVLSRVDWKIPQNKEKKKLPQPRHDQAPMRFRVVSGEHLFFAGTRSLEVEWQSPVFQKPYRLPGSAGGEKRRREVLFQAPVPKDELDAAGDGAPAIDTLSGDQLRALADLEDDRREGRITENAYQRLKRELLRKR